MASVRHAEALWPLPKISQRLSKAVCGRYNLALLCLHKNHPKVWEVEYPYSSGINVIAKNV